MPTTKSMATKQGRCFPFQIAPYVHYNIIVSNLKSKLSSMGEKFGTNSASLGINIKNSDQINLMIVSSIMSVY